MTEGFEVTTIDFLRHGHCEGGDILRGVTDSALSERGWQQMFRAVQPHSVPSQTRELHPRELHPLIKGSGGGWQQVVSSSLSRCRHFSEKLSQREQCPLDIDDDWRELNFGDWDGCLLKELWEQPQAVDYFTCPSDGAPPGGESIAEALQRFENGFNRLLETYRGKRVLVVTHGGMIRLAFSHLFQTPLNTLNTVSVPHGCLTRITISADRQQPRQLPQLVFHNPQGAQA